MPTVEETSDYYASAYRLDYGLTGGKPTRRHLSRSNREAETRLNLLKPLIKNGTRVLDFGCGAGVFLSLAKSTGARAMGIEPGKQFAAYARDTSGVQVINDIWENVEPVHLFDVITAIEVIEHLRNPVAALSWMSNQLSDDGVIYVTVPNMLPNQKETFRRFHFAHLHHFTPTTLQLAGAVCGLEVDTSFACKGTSIVFRKARLDAPSPSFEGIQGGSIAALYPRSSIARHLLTGRWMGSMGRRLHKFIRDSRGSGHMDLGRR